MLRLMNLSALIWMFLFHPTLSQAKLDEAQVVHQLQMQWDQGKYTLEGQQQIQHFEKLNQYAASMTQTYPTNPQILTWHGIIASTYAGIKGGMKALSIAKQAKASLEKAISLKPDVLKGSAYTSLGVLYDKVPGWPIGFGNSKKARELLETGLKIGPNELDNNYFYGSYLIDHGHTKMGTNYLVKALKLPTKENRPLADKGRRAEIKLLLSKLGKHYD